MNLRSRSFVVLLLLGIVIIGIQGWIVSHINSKKSNDGAESVFTSLGTKSWYDSQTNTTISKGPWGILERVPLTIAPPLEFASSMQTTFDPNVWHFVNYSPEKLQVLVSGLDIPLDLKNKILISSSYDNKSNSLTTVVDENIRQNLSASARQKLYNVLGIDSQNFYQENAYRFPTNKIDSIISESIFRSEIADIIKKLSYKNGPFTFFADAPLLQSHFKDDSERAEVLRGLATQSTYLIKLRISPETDMDALLAYWGKGGRAKDIGPFIESLRESMAEPVIDIVHFLPGFARRRLYTYPRPDETGDIGLRDCHWTAFNFFNDIPSEEYSGSDRIVEALDKEYTPIYGNFGFGDLVIFWDESKTIFHSAIMIADDILYTKNGASSSSPWIFMSLKDMKEFYPRDSKVSISYYRKNNI